jgi:uncharacterized protein YxeA
MQGESIFLLVFIFIILIAVGIIGILYFIHTSKYDESNTFYKNLLEIIKKNPNLSNDLEDKLFEKDFDIDDISDSQKELSNIFGAKIYSEKQLNNLNQKNKNYVDTQLNDELSNYPREDSEEYQYLKDSYYALDSNYTSNSNLFRISSTFFNNIDDHTEVTSNFNDIIDIMNINTSSNNSLKSEINTLNNLQTFYTISNDDLQITNGSNLKVTKLSICDNSHQNCFELTLNNSNMLVGKSSNNSSSILDNKPFVFAENNNSIYLPIFAGNNYELKKLTLSE